MVVFFQLLYLTNSDKNLHLLFTECHSHYEQYLKFKMKSDYNSSETDTPLSPPSPSQRQINLLSRHAEDERSSFQILVCAPPCAESTAVGSNERSVHRRSPVQRTTARSQHLQAPSALQKERNGSPDTHVNPNDHVCCCQHPRA